MSEYDIAVIGGGPGGYVAAIRAAQMGAKVALIEGSEVGGTCLIWGCIPTKTILASVNVYREALHAAEMGIKIEGELKVDYPAVIRRKNEVVADLVKGVHQLIKGNGIDYIKDFAKIEADRSINASGKTICAEKIIIATGSVWKEIPGFDRDSKQILSSDDLIDLETVPKSLCILGGGIVGCEFASIYSTLGSEVTIIEALDQILPGEDKFTARILTNSFKKRGIKILTGQMAKEVKKEPGRIRLSLSGGEEVEAEKLLVSVGRKPNFGGLDLKKIGVKTEKGAIVTDERMRTNIEGIYAIGDVNGKYMLAHTASEEGIVAVDNIMGHDSVMNYDAVPRPIYTNPEICGIGLTEKELNEKGVEFKTGRFSYAALSKAVVDNVTEGQVIVYSEQGTKKILGAQLVGTGATEISAELTLAIRLGLTVDDISKTIHAHPTLTEAVRDAVEDCESRAIHKVYRRSRS